MWNTTVGSPYGDNAIFGQFDQNILDRSLHIIVRNRRIYFGFYGDDTQGNITLSPGVWYHVWEKNHTHLGFKWILFFVLLI